LTLLAIRAAVDARIARTLTGKIALNNIAIPHIKRGLRGFSGHEPRLDSCDWIRTSRIVFEEWRAAKSLWGGLVVV